MTSTSLFRQVITPAQKGRCTGGTSATTTRTILQIVDDELKFGGPLRLSRRRCRFAVQDLPVDHFLKHYLRYLFRPLAQTGSSQFSGFLEVL
jgi:hypothetical protein